MIHTTTSPSEILPGEQPTATSSGMDSLLHPIKVDPEYREKKLDPVSRLDFATQYQIAYENCAITIFGEVAQTSLPYLIPQFALVQHNLGRPLRTTPVQAGSAHARVDSVQQHKLAEQSEDEEDDEEDDDGDDDDDDDDEESDEDDSDHGDNASSAASNLAQLLESLSIRAQRAGVDLRRLNDQQQQHLARLPFENQTEALLAVLQRQDPQRYVEVRNRMQQQQQHHQ